MESCGKTDQEIGFGATEIVECEGDAVDGIDANFGACFSHVLLSWRSLYRWILPVAVFGSSSTNSKRRGRL